MFIYGIFISKSIFKNKNVFVGKMLGLRKEEEFEIL